jgi:hypothetical protein
MAPLPPPAALPPPLPPPVPPLHTCPEQAAPIAQVVHAAPPLPQALLAVPFWHMPALSQQPVQVEVEQVEGALQAATTERITARARRRMLAAHPTADLV